MRIEQMRARYYSPANKLVNAILTDLKAAAEKIEQFLDEAHGRLCDCPFCAAEDSHAGDVAERDLAGLGWMLNQAEGIVFGLALPIDDPFINGLLDAHADDIDAPKLVAAG